MKDIVITSKSLRRELFVLLGCFVAAFGLNLYAVLSYSRPAVELVSQIGYVIVITIILYFLLLALRLVFLLIKNLIGKISA